MTHTIVTIVYFKYFFQCHILTNIFGWNISNTLNNISLISNFGQTFLIEYTCIHAIYWKSGNLQLFSQVCLSRVRLSLNIWSDLPYHNISVFLNSGCYRKEHHTFTLPGLNKPSNFSLTLVFQVLKWRHQITLFPMFPYSKGLWVSVAFPNPTVTKELCMIIIILC